MAEAPEIIAERAYDVLTQALRVLRNGNAAAALTLERITTLRLIDGAGPLSVAELAKLERVHASTMSRMVAALAKEGLIRRVPHQQDGRGTLLVLTPRGKSTVERALRASLQGLVAGLGKLSARDRAKVESAIETIEKLVMPERGTG